MTLADMMLNLLCDEDKEKLAISLIKELHHDILHFYGLDSKDSRACLTLLSYVMIEKDYNDYVNDLKNQ